MRIALASATAVLFILPAMAAEEVPLDVKSGAWNITLTQIVMPEESVLAQLPPDQRAQVEAQARSSGVPQSSTQCQTDEDRQKSLIADFVQTGCTPVISESTPQRFRAEVTCDGGNVVTKIEADAPNAETLVMKVDASKKGGGHTIIDIAGTFASDTCPAQ